MNLHAAGLRIAGYGMEVSMSTPPWPLPERPSVEQLRKQAKELRESEQLDSLSDAQLALARRYGFPSWPKLKLAVEQMQLREAIRDEDVERGLTLLEESPALATSRFTDGSTPLHAAAERNSPRMVELLVGHGASRETRFGQSAHTALSWALTCEAFDAARKLAELGEEPDLFCAAGLGDLERVTAFWSNGGLRHSPSRTGASRSTESGVPLPRPPRDDREQVSDALCFACRLGHVDVVRWLLDRGGDVEWRGYLGATCLAWAGFSGNPEVAALLREHSASDETTDFTFGAKPRTFAAFVFADWGFADRLYRLLIRDMSLLKATARIGTPLHAAAAEGQLKCVQLLVHLGADKAARDSDGRTPKDIATAKGYGQLAALL
jgi:ankyrin repeat protein